MNLFNIGKCFAQDRSIDNDVKVSYVINDDFTEKKLYLWSRTSFNDKTKFSIQKNSEEDKVRVYIARIVTLKKNDKAILIYCIMYTCLLFSI